MSHLVDIKLTIDDLDALQAACRELGLILNRGQTSHTWYGTSVGDYPLPAGFTADMLGHCAHAITVPGAKYQIGVYKNPVGRGYVLLYDFFGDGMTIAGKTHDGEIIMNKLGGQNLPKLRQAYALQRATAVARKQGAQVRRVMGSNGSITLQITGGRYL